MGLTLSDYDDYDADDCDHTCGACVERGHDFADSLPVALSEAVADLGLDWGVVVCEERLPDHLDASDPETIALAEELRLFVGSL